MILSNPPYIPSQELETLQPEVRDNEPPLALDGGEDGLSVIRPLSANAVRSLKVGGYLAIEIARGQASAVVALFHEAGFHEVGTRPDMAGIERIVVGRKP